MFTPSTAREIESNAHSSIASTSNVVLNAWISTCLLIFFPVLCDGEKKWSGLRGHDVWTVCAFTSCRLHVLLSERKMKLYVTLSECDVTGWCLDIVLPWVLYLLPGWSVLKVNKGFFFLFYNPEFRFKITFHSCSSCLFTYLFIYYRCCWNKYCFIHTIWSPKYTKLYHETVLLQCRR